MDTKHKVYFNDSRNLQHLENDSVDLILTSPPYPMIEMWDELFAQMNPEIEKKIKAGQSSDAFELMHRELDKVWKESFRLLKEGGIMCINIGDATRTLEMGFQLFSNHSRITNYVLGLGFLNLPNILWRKPTNAPNKFMGSGMLPVGAYVTLEHEYILVFRKGKRREFNTAEEKKNRNQSAYFWEERNSWFSDIWDIRGVKQLLKDATIRKRSAAFPFEFAYRMIQMYSVKGDTILDPFFGTGTTMVAGMSSERNSIGIELDSNFKDLIENNISSSVAFCNAYTRSRLENHLSFVEQRDENKTPIQYINNSHKFPVMTKQEMELELNVIQNVEIKSPLEFSVSYEKIS